MKSVQLAHGSGGQAMQQLIGDLFMQAFANPWLAEQEDQARLDLAALAAQGDRLAFSTDSYVIDPLFFPGGNIGKLAVCGTANDVAVSGAIPRYLSCGFILEEGLEMATLETVVAGMADTARAAGIAIVTGDTKVVPRGAADKLFINTAGIGAIPADIRWGTQQISAGDVLLVSGTLGDHGATILNLREQMGLDGALSSDCAVLTPLIQTLRPLSGVKALRDATRGGVNAVAYDDTQTIPLKLLGYCDLEIYRHLSHTFYHDFAACHDLDLLQIDRHDSFAPIVGHGFAPAYGVSMSGTFDPLVIRLVRFGQSRIGAFTDQCDSRRRSPALHPAGQRAGERRDRQHGQK